MRAVTGAGRVTPCAPSEVPRTCALARRRGIHGVRRVTSRGLLSTCERLYCVDHETNSSSPRRIGTHRIHGSMLKNPVRPPGLHPAAIVKVLLDAACRRVGPLTFSTACQP